MNEQRKARYKLAFSVHGGLGSQRPLDAKVVEVSETLCESAFPHHVTGQETFVTCVVSDPVPGVWEQSERLFRQLFIPRMGTFRYFVA